MNWPARSNAKGSESLDEVLKNNQELLQNEGSEHQTVDDSEKYLEGIPMETDDALPSPKE